MKRIKLKIEVEEFLEKLKIQNISRAGDEINFSCPFDGHQNGDRHPSARMNANTTAWICHGCKRSGNAITFLANLENVSKSQAVSWIKNSWGNPLPDTKTLLSEIDELITERQYTIFEQEFRPSPDHSEFLDRRKEHFLSHQVSKNMWNIEYYQNISTYFKTHNLEYEYVFKVLEKIGFIYLPNNNKIIIPIYNHHGEHCGYKSRRFAPGPKFIIEIPTYPKSLILSAYQNFDISKNSYKEVLICESELDVLRMKKIGYACVALGGSAMSEMQQQIIVENFDSVTLLMDNDWPGMQATFNIGKLLSKKIEVFIVNQHFFKGVGKDPCSMDAQTLTSIINLKIPYIEFEFLVKTDPRYQSINL